MYHQDFILRQIERLAKAIQQMLSYHRSGRVDEAYDLLDNCYQESSGFLRAQLQDWEPEAFLDRLEEDGLAAQELEALSQLTEAEGQMLEAEEDYELARHRYQITLMLLNKAAERDLTNFSLERQSRLSQLRKRLDNLA